MNITKKYGEEGLKMMTMMMMIMMIMMIMMMTIRMDDNNQR